MFGKNQTNKHLHLPVPPFSQEHVQLKYKRMDDIIWVYLLNHRSLQPSISLDITGYGPECAWESD